jgi:cation transport ATPase
MVYDVVVEDVVIVRPREMAAVLECESSVEESMITGN